jgi:cholestenol delta-isomerase
MADTVSQMLSNTTKLLITDHPYYPLEVELANYLANEWSVPVLLGIFFSVCGLVFFGTMSVVNRVHPHLPAAEKAAIWWLILCKYSKIGKKWGIE